MKYPQTPRVHGNGFIQFDLGPHHRLHVWGHPRIPKQKTSTQIHDHGYSFTSYVMKGAIRNINYTIEPNPLGAYEIYEGRTSDSILHPTGCRVTIVDRESSVHVCGERYSMPERVFHESQTLGPTITIINKSGPSLAQGGPIPRILVPVGVEPDNEFDRYAFDQDELFQIFQEVLERTV